MDLDINVGVVRNITAVIREDAWDHFLEIDLLFSVNDVRYYAQSVKVSADGRVRHDVTSVVLRQVKVGEAVRLAASGGIFLYQPDEKKPHSFQDLYGIRGEQSWVEEIGDDLTSRGPTESNLKMIGWSYMIAQLSGEPPAKAVERIYSLPARTASTWIARAKMLGFIRKPEVIKMWSD